MEKRIDYRLVDLGLPSGLKWADRNVGAKEENDYGEYFAFGAVKGKRIERSFWFGWKNCPFNNGSEDCDEGYFNAHKEELASNDGTLKPDYDAAANNIGDGWRMPTESEIKELIEFTDHEIGVVDGVNGYFFISKNGNGERIFIPSSGYCDKGNLMQPGMMVDLWSSSVISGETNEQAYRLYARSGFIDGVGETRCCGLCVRGVHGKIEYKMVDLGLQSGLKWADRNVGALTPQDYGDYFMWGSVTPDTGKICDWAHSPLNNGSQVFDEAYFNEHNSEWLTDKGVLKPEYDAAHAIMGGNWRMPTHDEILELFEGTTHTFETLHGVNGMRFTGKSNGNSIFMPFGGFRCDSCFCDRETDGDFTYTYCKLWSSSIFEGRHDGSHSAHIRHDGIVCTNGVYNCGGIPVRGVHE